MKQNKSAEAIPFIVYDQKEGFQLNKDAENYLNSLPQDRKLGLISIVGKYRTGKSFFVNRVLLDRQKDEQGFQVGPTINPCTKGLWLWKKELQSIEDENMDILLIDTEGFGGMDENLNHDSRIFLFSLLLSSYFIYNSQGSIDENALNNLSLIINLAKDIQIKSKNNESQQEDPANYFPSFLWVIRDFALQIVDQMGNKISQKDYLEKALELQKGVSDAIESKNRIRRLMKHFFKERDCCTLVRPVESEKDLQNLNSMSNEELRPEFVEQIFQLRKKIFKKVKPKMLCGRSLNGQMLVEICKAYTEAINKGSLPNIENAWTYVKKSETIKAFDKSVQKLDTIIQELQMDTVDPNKIETIKENARQEMKKVLKKNALGEEEDLQEYYQQIDEQLTEKFRDFKKQNKLQWKRKYAEMCNEQVTKIEKKLNNEEYNNFLDFQADLLKFKEEFEKQVPQKDLVAEKFFTEISEKLHKLAAEKVNKKQEREHYKQLKQIENILAITENDLKHKKDEFESERRRYVDKINLLERDVATLKANESIHQQKMQMLQEENEKLQKAYQQYKTTYKEESLHKEKETVKRIKELEISLEQHRTDGIKKAASFEKQVALLEQESQFNQRENKSLREKINHLENENRKLRADNTSHLSTIDRLKHQIDEQIDKSNRELVYVKNEFEKKVEEITSETDKKKDIIKQHSEFIIEKTYLENQVSFYKNQLEENKKLHDALLIALQQGMSKDDQESNNELVETNRNLSAAMDKIEQRCKLLEEKNEKLKQYKKMFKNSSALQCTHCSKFIANNIFLNHVNSCIQKNNVGNTSINLSGSGVNVPVMSTMPYNTIPANFLNLDPNYLLISINQTMVRESPDNKPYTEYLIQLSYQNIKWEVARKYKNFCELHQQLMSTFPGLKFPDSSLAIINSSTDINNVFYSKRPTVIEDRRKALQQYVRDLAKMDLVRNSKPYKNFLEIDKNVEMKQISQGNIQQQKAMAVGGHHNTLSNNTDDLKSILNSIVDGNIVNSHQQMQHQQQQHQQQQFMPQQHIQQQQQQQQQQQYNYQQQQQQQQQYLNQEQFMYNPHQNVSQSSNLYKVDKKMMPQSPTSFLKSWNEKNINKENNPRTSSTSHNQNYDVVIQSQLNNKNQIQSLNGNAQIRQGAQSKHLKIDLSKKRNSQVYCKGDSDMLQDNSNYYMHNHTIDYN
ncbi:hypothetical protein ABPG74_006940 [Tetrahymena malaccensis]